MLSVSRIRYTDTLDDLGHDRAVVFQQLVWFERPGMNRQVHFRETSTFALVDYKGIVVIVIVFARLDRAQLSQCPIHKSGKYYYNDDDAFVIHQSEGAR